MVRHDQRAPTFESGSHDGALSGPGASSVVTPAASASGEGGGGDALATPEPARYERRSVLGHGGMGRVVLARDRRLERDVALKEVTSADADAARALEARLAREAAVTARLEHPGIVPVYDAGRGADGRVYYTMRVVRGRSLDDALRDAASDEARARFLRHVLDASQAVAWAHRHGIVHRDLKPANIMVGEFGETQVVDWGLARAVDRAEAPLFAGAGDDPALTSVGAVVGTPHYMSPEQALGQPADQRSDVWSLGFVLYEVATGRRARPATSASAALADARLGAPRPSLDGLPPALAAIIRRAVAPRPADRYADAKAFADDLAAYLDGRRVTAHAYTTWELVARLVRAWRVPLAIAAAGLVALAVALGVGFASTAAERDRAEEEKERAEDARGRAERAEERSRAALERAEVELARALVGAARGLADRQAWAEAEITAAASLAHAEGPDARGMLAVLGGGVRPLRVAMTPLPACQQFMPSSDGARGVCLDATGASVLALADGRTLSRVEGVGLALPVLLEDDDLLVVWGTPFGDLRFIDADSGRVVDAYGFCCASFEPGADGSFAFGTALDEVHVIVDAHTSSTIPRPCGTVIAHVAVAHEGERLRTFGACPDGRFEVGTSGADAPIHGRIQAEGQPELCYGSAFVPGQDRVVVGGNKGEAAVIALPSGVVERRTRHLSGLVQAVGVSADGSLAALRDERPGIWLWDLVTGAELGRLPSDARDFRWDGWQPRRLYTWTRGALTTWELPRGRPGRLPVGGGVSALELSPDGQRLAVAATQRAEVYTLDDGRRALAVALRAVVKSLAFSADGGELLAAFSRDRTQRVDLATGDVRDTQQAAWTRRVGRLASGAIVHLALAMPLVVQTATGALVELVPGEREGRDLTLTPDRREAFALLGPDTIVAFDDDTPPSATEVATDAPCSAIAASPDGEHLACAERGRASLLDRTGATRALLDAGEDVELLEVAWSPDGRWVAAGGRTGGVYVWAVESRRLVARATEHAERVAALLFDPAGRWLASGSWDNSVDFMALDVLDADPLALLEDAEAAWGLSRHDVVRSGAAITPE